MLLGSGSTGCSGAGYVDDEGKVEEDPVGGVEEVGITLPAESRT